MNKIILLIFIFLSIANKNFCFSQNANADLMKKAVSLSEEGKFKESNDNLVYLYSQNYMKDYVCYYLAVNYFAMYDYTKAQKYAKQVVDMNSDYMLKCFTILGKCLNNSNKFNEERCIYNKVSKKFPNEYLPFYCKALSFKDENINDSACVYFIKAINCYNFCPDIHFNLAKTLYSQELYIHSLLAYYFFLLTEPKEERSFIAINYIYNIMNFKESDRVIAQKINDNNYYSKADQELISCLMFINGLKKSNIDNNTKLPDCNVFINNSKSILTDICETIETRDNFYENFYVNFFTNLIKNNFLDEYLYLILNSKYENINKVLFTVNQNKLTKFADWLQSYFETNNYK
ncbi:MAG: hypothetical protein MJ211_02500 [Bacteroidales bacterium]|nr:hypothetical protein [Bacteroidales bacterium]